MFGFAQNLEGRVKKTTSDLSASNDRVIPSQQKMFLISLFLFRTYTGFCHLYYIFRSMGIIIEDEVTSASISLTVNTGGKQ